MSNADRNHDSDIQELLAKETSPGKGRQFFKVFVWSLLLLVIVIILLQWGIGHNKKTTEYKTTEARRGDLTVIVTATGNLEPTNQVEVGSEVSGTIASVLVDYNDFVKQGQVLAKLDTTKLQAQVNQSKAAVQSARASLLQVKATVLEAQNELNRLQHVRKLTSGKLPSKLEIDAAEAALKRAQADEAMARAQIDEAEATLRVDETNLEKAIIISPINGVVLERSVEPGQTVAASLQAPVLFTLAEDLTKMELHVDVDEADVGQVKEGQQATFTVDAYPDRVFPAHITQVRYGSQTSEGVVTYLTELNVDNSDLSLRPGMTATADIVVEQVKDALLIPNTALRFSPPQLADGDSRSSGGSLLSKLFPRPRHMKTKKEETGDSKEQRVWTLRDGQPVPISVTTGATSGIMTQIVSADITAGTPLIIEATSKGQ